MIESMSVTLGAVISITKGKKHNIVGSPSTKAKRLIGIDDLRNDDLIRYTDDASGTEAILDDVLIAWDGANAGTIGYGKKGYIGSTIARLRVRPGQQLFTPFLGMYLKSKFDYLRQTATGATIPHINRNALESIPLPKIDFNDQVRTAHLLGKVEGVIAHRKQRLQQLDDLLKSVFLKMFGDPVRNNKGWETKTLPQLVLPEKNSLKRGPFGGALKKEIFVEAGYLVYEQNHALNDDYSFARYFVTEEKYKELIDFQVNPGDILISCSGVYLGKLSIVPEGAKAGIINQALLKISLDDQKIRSRFFVHIFGSPQFKSKYFPSNRGGAIPNLPPMSVMKEIPFISPPIELQQEFSDIFEKVDGLKSQYQQNLTNLEALYGALSQQAFKGELDLSRVSLPGIQTGAKKVVVVEPLQTPDARGLPINLPDISALLDTVQGPVRQQSILMFWLDAYSAQLDSTPFSVQHFMALAKPRLEEMYSDYDFELGANDYEHIKLWVFEALAAGRLQQSCNITGHDDNGAPVLGNGIELMVAQA